MVIVFTLEFFTAFHPGLGLAWIPGTADHARPLRNVFNPLETFKAACVLRPGTQGRELQSDS
ncbi:MAG: hypothetical protein C4581_09370 [Nitrospiraceae bacterium]|nr:MAG: hypothetical protein C4581_09370 [Nitrospiraceae bacterium]